MRLYRVLWGTHARLEDGRLVLYERGDVIRMREAGAERLGGQVAPVEEAGTEVEAARPPAAEISAPAPPEKQFLQRKRRGSS